MYCTPFFSLAVTGRIQNPNLAVFVAEELATLSSARSDTASFDVSSNTNGNNMKFLVAALALSTLALAVGSEEAAESSLARVLVAKQVRARRSKCRSAPT